MSELTTCWRAALSRWRGQLVGLAVALLRIIPATLPLAAPGYFFNAHDFGPTPVRRRAAAITLATLVATAAFCFCRRSRSRKASA